MAPLPPLDAVLPDNATLAAAFALVLRATAQASLVVLVILVARILLARRLAPRARYALWGLLALPIVAPLLPGVTIPLPDFGHRTGAPAPLHLTRSAPAPVTTQTRGWRVEYGPVVSGPQLPARRTKPMNWLCLGGIVWLTGAGMLLLRLGVTHVRAVRLARRAQPLTEPALLALLEECRQIVRTRRTPRLVAAPPGAGPALLGFLRPCLLLPLDAPRRLSEVELRFVLLHELVHLRRADALAEWFLTLFQVVHWFNPLVRFAAARCRADREIACDAAVVALAGESRRADYGRTILRLATELAAEFSPRRFPPVALGILETRSPLERRLRMLASAPTSRASRWAAPLVGLLALALVACTNGTPAGTEKAQSVKPEPAAVKGAPPMPRPGPDAQPDVLNVANDWPDVRASRDRIIAEERGDPKNAAARAQLDRVIPELSFEAAQFTDVVDRFREITGANLFINWKALENAGIDKTAPVTVRLRDVRFGKALTVILDSLSGGTVPLGYTVDDGVITVTTGEDLDRNTITRVYDVRDLIIPIPNYEPPPANEQPAKAKTDEQVAAERAEREANGVRTGPKSIDRLIRMITETVAPDSWPDAGGSTGSIRELQGQLIITQSRENHLELATLLEHLRQSRALQVTVEARFIAADDALLDALPKGLREKVAGQLRAAKDPIALDRSPRKEPDKVPGKSVEKSPDEPDPAAGVYLSAADVDAVLRAVQGSKNAAIVSAPRMTLFNGQAAYVLVMTQRAYVADYTVEKQPDGGTKYEPLMGTANSGVMLWAQATASADRRHSTLSIHPRLTQLTGFEDVPWHQQPAAGAEKLSVQRPNILLSELRLTTTIPDGQTLLLGGLKGVFSADWDKAPAKEAPRNVILLVKPTIIIQREVDGPQFPLLPPKASGR